MSLAKECRSKAPEKAARNETTKTSEAAQLGTPSARTQTSRHVAVLLEHPYENRMVELIKGSTSSFVPQGAYTFPLPTVFLIIKKQQLGRDGSASPLVVVKNGHERPDGRLLSDRMHEIYRILHTRREPWPKIQFIPKEIEASSVNRMWITLGLGIARDHDRADIFRLCFPRVADVVDPIITIEHQMVCLKSAQCSVEEFRAQRSLLRSDADEFTEEENAFVTRHNGYGER